MSDAPPDTHPVAVAFLEAYARGERDFANTRWKRTTLVEATLTDCNMEGILFEDCLLGGSRFDNSNLKGARFSRCNLIGCHFDSCELEAASFAPSALWNASFYMAGLAQADLSECDAHGSSFVGARLIGTKLVGTDLSGSLFGMTALKDVDLLFVQLKDTEHAFRSIVDDATIKRTADSLSALASLAAADGLSLMTGLDPAEVRAAVEAGAAHIPELREFLLRAGCSRDDLYMIDAVAPEASKEFASVFISYSSRDEEFARWLDSHLRAYGIDVWFAPHTMRGGQRIRDQVDRAIGDRDKIILILSDASLESSWVATELTKAFVRESQQGIRILYPIRIVGFERLKDWELFDSDLGLDIAKRVREYFIPDFSDWDRGVAMPHQLHRLVDDLRQS